MKTTVRVWHAGAFAGEDVTVLTGAPAARGLSAVDRAGRVPAARSSREVETEPARLESALGALTMAPGRLDLPSEDAPCCRRTRDLQRPSLGGGIPARFETSASHGVVRVPGALGSNVSRPSQGSSLGWALRSHAPTLLDQRLPLLPDGGDQGNQQEG